MSQDSSDRPANPLDALLGRPAKPLTTTVARRAPVRRVSARALLASAAGIALLIVMAGLGIYFSVHQRPAKPQPISEPNLVSNEAPPIISQSSNPQPRPIEIASRPVATFEPLPVEPMPIAAEPEALAILPREFLPEPVLIEPTRPIARVEKPTPEPTLEPPKREPRLPAIVEKPKPDAAAQLPPTEQPERTADRFGTTINFLATPALAYERARTQKDKLVMLLHYAGSFERGRFTCEAAESLRTEALLDDEVADYVNENFICSHQRVGAMRLVNGVESGGTVVTYFCLSDGTVLHTIAGPVDGRQFLQEAHWIVDTRKSAILKMQGDLAKYNAAIRKAHADRYFNDYGEPTDPLGGLMLPGRPFAPRFVGGFGPGFGPFGGLGGMAPDPLNPKLPTQRPTKQAPQAQVHWLLARLNAPKLGDIYKTIYQDILKEKLADR
jgi:hypothetical protein